ncbi:MAG: hydroxymethylbilane synthase [Synergistaceae bacterium]|jgi:hydroxymethylbilane synthase|nr:hydroxymethylbilane synthase [Synergistaceae bacterium]
MRKIEKMGKIEKIRVGSRDSVLAVAQARLVMEALTRAHSGVALELVTMKTAGDLRAFDFPQAQEKEQERGGRFGVKGLFVKELEQALLDGRIDVAVHSLKDMPMEQDRRLPIRAFFKRGDPRDALVSSLEGEPFLGSSLSLGSLPFLGSLPLLGAKEGIGCSSARRRVQLARLMPGPVRPVRGNVLTRLKKLDEGQYSFLVLAAVGLRRLGLERRISRIFAPEEMIPAAGQGSLACQGREGDRNFIEAVNDPDTEDCAKAERAFVARLGGGCTLPVAAYARVRGTEMSLIGLYVDEPEGLYRRGALSGDRQDAVKLGEVLASRLQKDKI